MDVERGGLGRHIALDQLPVVVDQQQARSRGFAPMQALPVDQEAVGRARHYEAEVIADRLAEAVALRPAQRGGEVDASLADGIHGNHISLFDDIVTRRRESSSPRRGREAQSIVSMRNYFWLTRM